MKLMKLLHRHVLVSASIIGFCAPSFAQTVDAAVEVKEGALGSFAADIEVGLKTGVGAAFADEKWYVVGACSNLPTVKIAMKMGISGTFADRQVGVVSNRISADRVICITNAEELSEELRKALRLSQQNDGY